MGKPWFRTKRYGYGAGLPCSWEGWAVLLGFAGVMITLSSLAPHLATSHPRLFTGFHVGLILGVVFIAWRKSDKPWGWRWGGE